MPFVMHDALKPNSLPCPAPPRPARLPPHHHHHPHPHPRRRTMPAALPCPVCSSQQGWWGCCWCSGWGLWRQQCPVEARGGLRDGTDAARRVRWGAVQSAAGETGGPTAVLCYRVQV